MVGFCGGLPILGADDGQTYLTLLVYVGVVDFGLENNLSRKRNKHHQSIVSSPTFDISNKQTSYHAAEGSTTYRLHVRKVGVAYLWWLEGVLCWEVDLDSKGTTTVRGLFL